MGIAIPEGFGVAALEWNITGRAEKVVSTIGYRPAADLSLNQNADAAAILELFWVTGRPSFNAQTSNQYQLKGVGVTFMSSTGPQVGYATANAQGTAAYPPVPSNCAVLVRKVTNRGGRKGRGRMFWPPINFAEADVGPTGVITAAQVTFMQTWFNNLMTAMATSPIRFVLLHSDGTAPNDITSLIVQGTLATQRRRMR